MLNIRKNTLFIGLLVVANLFLLVGCEGCGKRKEDTKQKLEKEAKQLVGKLADKLKFSNEKKKEFESNVIKDVPSEEEADQQVTLLSMLQASLKLPGAEQKVLPEVNQGVQQIVPGAAPIKDVQEASEVLDLVIDLLKNAKERAKLKGKPKK